MSFVRPSIVPKGQRSILLLLRDSKCRLCWITFHVTYCLTGSSGAASVGGASEAAAGGGAAVGGGGGGSWAAAAPPRRVDGGAVGRRFDVDVHRQVVVALGLVFVVGRRLVRRQRHRYHVDLALNEFRITKIISQSKHFFKKQGNKQTRKRTKFDSIHKLAYVQLFFFQ